MTNQGQQPSFYPIGNPRGTEGVQRASDVTVAVRDEAQLHHTGGDSTVKSRRRAQPRNRDDKVKNTRGICMAC
eukprot:7959475-Pyramimonas_sp.AAC.1